MAGNTNLPTENIDEVILRLLALEPNEIDDISYEIYSQYLRELLVEITSNKRKIDSGEAELVQKEFKRVRSKKGRFKLKSKKSKVSASSFGVGGVRKQLKQTQQRFLLVGTATSVPDSKGDKVSKNKKDPDILERINDRLGSILKTLIDISKEDKKLREKERKDEENKRRQSKEKGLETKVFDGIKSTISKVMKPFQSIFDWILNFFTNVFLGKVVMKLLGWFSDPKNSDKIKSLIKFFTDWWPTMLGAYLLFGTSFGKLTRTLVGFAGKSVIGLGKVIYRLIAAIAKGKSLKVAGAFAGGRKGLGGGGGGGGWKGALGRGALSIGGSLLAGFAIDKGVDALSGGGEEEKQDKIDVPDAPKIPMLGAATGGLADIGKIFGNFGGNMMGGMMGSMFGPLGMLMGSMMGGNLPNIFQGLVKGKKGTDKIPAMLTDGEFVMSKGAVQKYGIDTLEAMNAAGGGTNVPKVIKGIPHAASGGYFGNMSSNTVGEGESPYVVSEKQFKNAQDLDLASRVKRIEEQVKVQRALSSGKGIQTTAGRGFGTTYGGRQSILVKGGTRKLGAGAGYNAITVPEINAGGMRYFAQQRGQDIIYTSNFARGLSGQVDKYGARSRGYSGKGGGLMGGMSAQDKKNLPKTKIMMGPDGPFVGYLSYKNGQPTYSRPKQRNAGMLESIADFFNPGGKKKRQETLNARTMRLTAISDLEDMRRRGMKEDNIKKMMNERLGANGYSRAVNDAKAKQARINKESSQKNLDRLSRQGAGYYSEGKRYEAEKIATQQEYENRGNIFGQIGRGFTRMFSDPDSKLGSERLARLSAEDKASQARVKQAGAASIGRYYSSSDGKYYANYAAAEKARDARRAKLASQQRTRTGVRPPTKPSPTSRSTYRGGQRSSGVNPSTGPGSTRTVSPTRRGSTAQTARQLGVHHK